MDKQLRIKGLKELRENESEIYMSGIRIRYKNDIEALNAYQVPHEFLVFNKYNGRIASLVKSYEKQNHELDPENPEHSKIVEEFLWKSHQERNKITEADLVENRQRVHGIVTHDGKIIDGNRRAMLLKKIFSLRNSKYKGNAVADWSQYFIAVILPDTISDDKEISKLETIYQMGEDKKLDYNPIEKYLKCVDLKEIYGFDEADIAKMMGESTRQIKEWLNILNVMEDYLFHLDYEGIYTRLERREGQFRDLTKYLDRYRNAEKNVKWNYKDKDIAHLKSICFDYIRARYEGKDFRAIAQTSRASGSIFQYEDIWNEFRDRHEKNIEPITNAQPSVAEARNENPDADLTKVLSTRDDEWLESASDNLKQNLGIGESRLQNKLEANKPLQLAMRALDTLNSINTDIDGFYDPAIDSVLSDIVQVTNKYRKRIKTELK